jgi:hypothetical protein
MVGGTRGTGRTPRAAFLKTSRQSPRQLPLDHGSWPTGANGRTARNYALRCTGDRPRTRPPVCPVASQSRALLLDTPDLAFNTSTGWRRTRVTTQSGQCLVSLPAPDRQRNPYFSVTMVKRHPDFGWGEPLRLDQGGVRTEPPAGRVGLRTPGENDNQALSAGAASCRHRR